MSTILAFAIKAEIRETHARSFAFAGQKTMYGGKRIAEGDTIFLFASENEGGQGLIAQGVVTSVTPIARKPAIPRQAPCVSISVNRTGVAKRPLGRSELTSSSIARRRTKSSAFLMRRLRSCVGTFRAVAEKSRGLAMELAGSRLESIVDLAHHEIEHAGDKELQ